MLKKRIAATLVVRDGLVVQSIGFTHYLPVGKPHIAVEYLDDWGIDEIILLDISASQKGAPPNYTMVRNVSTQCHVPLTIGGGITNIDHILGLMHCGADKVSFNQSALHQPDLLSTSAKLFGAQCVVASIDGQRVGKDYRVYDYLQKKVLDITTAEFARQLQDLGAGEILINSVDQDGVRCGFDQHLINSVCEAVSVPVICCGGAGNPQHFVDVFQKTNVSAASAANFFHFTEHSVTTTKALVNRQILVRHESHANYEDSHFNSDGRLLKKNEKELEELLYRQVEKEII